MDSAKGKQGPEGILNQVIELSLLKTSTVDWFLLSFTVVKFHLKCFGHSETVAETVYSKYSIVELYPKLCG